MSSPFRSAKHSIISSIISTNDDLPEVDQKILANHMLCILKDAKNIVNAIKLLQKRNHPTTSTNTIQNAEISIQNNSVTTKIDDISPSTSSESASEIQETFQPSNSRKRRLQIAGKFIQCIKINFILTVNVIMQKLCKNIRK